MPLILLAIEFTLYEKDHVIQGIFGMVVKDLKGNKTKHGKENDADDSSISEELSALFSTVNFLHSDETRCSSVVNNEDVELDIGNCHNFYSPYYVLACLHRNMSFLPMKMILTLKIPKKNTKV